MHHHATTAQALAVAIGAALGALARWRISVAMASITAPFPLGTLVVNALGGVAIGIAMALVARSSLWHLFLVTGVLGGFTTFSAFSAESLSLIERGQWPMALLHSAAHVVGALACTALGYAVARALLKG